ncbi:hypothetical protein [Pseudonocardia sp. GCM10023141]|uniref:hypothetical protein n=1 Tax=Pseudonocardia sp. GCM10023141 TaxID=3252653 RepID=UPI00360F6E40
MYFLISDDAVELVDPQDVKAFSVRCPADLDHAGLAASVDRAELGEILDSGHLMVPVATIRRMAGDRVGPGWDNDLAGMLAYAASKGWTSADGSRVRAHVERV